MFGRLIIIAGVLFILNPVGWAAEAAPEFTQKDFAQLIVNNFSWNTGLPEKQSDRDYLLILGGKRAFTYEAENAYNEKTDLVTMRENIMFGPFTGKGWLLGISETTSSDFTILVPIQGEYTFKAVIKGNGFVWNLDNRDYRADSRSGNFREVEVGKIPLKAGIVKIKVTIPPEGAIDSFSFTAADHAPIQPLIGWRFKERLNAGRMAEIAVSMMSLYPRLPDARDNPLKSLSVSEVALVPATAAKTGITHLGRFTSREWVRADYRGATIQIPLKATDVGLYGITANATGARIKGRVNDSPFDIQAKSYLDKVPLGLFRLESGDNMITVDLPPMGGIDTLEFSKKSTTPDDFLRLAGIKGPAERLVTAEEAAAFLKTIQAAYQIRK